MPRSSADHVAVTDTALIDKSRTAHLNIETAFRNGRHTFPFKDPRRRHNLSAVTDNRHRFIVSLWE